ncbi:uncharacterized protein ACRADG_006491 isoform 2-T2 [Cochliomyia hominivorax]
MPSAATSCRACLKETLESYFEMNNKCYFTPENCNFKDIFNFCTRLKVQTSDRLPQRICIMCVQDLKQTYEFLQKVLENDKKLNEYAKLDYDNDNNVKNYENCVKDPLENATDSDEDFNINENKSEITGATDNKNDEFYCSPLDNTDNIVEESHRTTTPLNESGDDKDVGDFFKSIESQIFPQGRYKCKICQKPYFTNVGLEAHMDAHLPKGKTISKSSLLDDKHIKKKNRIKFFSNSEDENSDSPNSKLPKNETNVKIPKPKKTFPCEVCGKQMISASKLRYHMVMHTGEKDYLCTMCPKAYSTIYALKHHMRAHTGERPYECKFCGDRFLRPTTLKSHMRRHTGERPYGCDICGKRFIQHSSMATHMKLNHMDKTIPCPYCDKKYARQTDLNTHLLSHSGDKPFACQMCTSRFTRQSNLNKHVNQHHGGVNMGGDKKLKKTILKETTIIKDELLHERKNDINKDMSSNYTLETPTCSSHLKF